MLLEDSSKAPPFKTCQYTFYLYDDAPCMHVQLNAFDWYNLNLV